MADFRVVPAPPPTSAHPGGCFLCKTDPRVDMQGKSEKFVDPHVEVQVGLEEGHSLVFCRSCVIEMGHLFKMVPAELHAEVENDLDDALVVASDLAFELDAARQFNRDAAFGPKKAAASKKAS